MHNSMIKCANERKDDWSQAVLDLLGTCIDLVAAEAVYHLSCMADFKLNQVGGSGFRGRPRNSKYRDHVYFVKSAGCKGELVCFKEMTDYILRQLKELGSETKEEVVKAADKIIKEEIREMNFSKEFYPSVDEVSFSEEGEKWIPESLRMFMKFLVPSTKS